MSDANRYTELIAGAHFDKPRYQQFIYELTEPLNEARKRLAVFVCLAGTLSIGCKSRARPPRGRVSESQGVRSDA
ncbi:hypothetical protein [Parasutterella excrementihominis]|uniref:hypothetical protein n=1 Tax=Parasutterella excrementihominis TaxID=487175 RepID=UPI003AF0AACE